MRLARPLKPQRSFTEGAGGGDRYDLDEAMHRRITLAIEFTKPDHLLRERIW
jgi:hypothetical protein